MLYFFAFFTQDKKARDAINKNNELSLFEKIKQDFFLIK